MCVCVCVFRAAFTILLKYAGIASIHILFMITNMSVLRAMQFAVTERVWVDNVNHRQVFLRAPVFNSSCLSYSLTLMTTEIPQCDMIIMFDLFVQSDKNNP